MLTRAAPFLKTPIKEFFHFLEGKKIPPYEDTGEKLINNLSSVLYKCLHERFKEFRRTPRRSSCQNRKLTRNVMNVLPVKTLFVPPPSSGAHKIGTFQEYAIGPESYVDPVPEGLDPLIAIHLILLSFNHGCDFLWRNDSIHST